MKIAVLFSGGKDSTYATWIAQHYGWDVEVLVTVLPRTSESMMFHFPNAGWTKLQAEAMGLPHQVILAGKDELLSLKEGLAKTSKNFEIDGVATGAVASDYQKSRIDQVSDSLGIKSFAPIWHKDPRTIVDDLKTAGFKIRVSGVAAEGLEESWLGQELTSDAWDRLESLSRKTGIHLTGEGGEYETFVVDAPFFKQRIRVEKSHNQWDGQSGHLVIDQATLEHKLSN